MASGDDSLFACGESLGLASPPPPARKSNSLYQYNPRGGVGGDDGYVVGVGYDGDYCGGGAGYADTYRADEVGPVTTTATSTAAPQTTAATATAGGGGGAAGGGAGGVDDDHPRRVESDEDLARHAADLQTFLETEFDLEVLGGLLDSEQNYLPDPTYLETIQTKLDVSLRKRAVDWILEVNDSYRLHRETCYLAVNYLDRFLSVVRLTPDHLPLLAAACVLLAAKAREIPDHVFWDLVRHGDLAPTKLRRMETMVLDKLEWMLTVPTPHVFFSQYMSALNINVADYIRLRKHAEFFVDVACSEYVFLALPPSAVAAVALLCGLANLNAATDEAAEYLAQLIGLPAETLNVAATELMRCFAAMCPGGTEEPATPTTAPREVPAGLDRTFTPTKMSVASATQFQDSYDQGVGGLAGGLASSYVAAAVPAAAAGSTPSCASTSSHASTPSSCASVPASTDGPSKAHGGGPSSTNENVPPPTAVAAANTSTKLQEHSLILSDTPMTEATAGSSLLSCSGWDS